MSDQKTTALVTGCLGFIGSHVCEELLRKNRKVIGADLLSGSFEFFDRRVEFFPCDITDPASVQKLCSSISCDEVYHTASIFNYSTPPSVLHRVNIEGTKNLLEAITKTQNFGGRLRTIVHWSSGSINGRARKDEPASEDDPWCPANDYERSKGEQEKLVRNLATQQRLPVIFLRPAGVYGPRSRYGLEKIIELASRGLVHCFIGNPQTRQSMVHVADVVGAAIWLAEHPACVGEAYNVADDLLYTSGDLTRYLVDMFQTWFIPMAIPILFIKPLIFLSEWFGKVTRTTPLLIRDLLDHMEAPFLVSNKKLKNAGYTLHFPDTKMGLNHTINWYRTQGWMK